jgi:N utilization substance protein A
MHFDAAESNLTMTIGKRGLTTKLTSKKMNWRLDIRKESVPIGNCDDKLERAVVGWSDVPGITKEIARKSVATGITYLEVFENIESHDLMGVGFNHKKAEQIVRGIWNACRKQ